MEGMRGRGTKRTYRNTLKSSADHLQETLLTFELGGLLSKGQHTGRQNVELPFDQKWY